MSIEKYREDYPGEYIVTNITFKDGKKAQEKEWVDNPIENTHFSPRATCIKTSSKFIDFFYKKVQNNNGGVLAKMKMQVYGVEDVYTKMTPEFIITQDENLIDKMIVNDYTSTTTVYSNAKNCIRRPGELYLIPHGIAMTSEGAAAWLACFDGHTEVYLVGYEMNDPDTGEERTKMIANLTTIMKAFKNNVKFIHVTNYSSPEDWKRQINFSAITQREYVTQCDV